MMYDQFPPHFVVKDGIHGVGVFTLSAFKKNDTLFKMEGMILAIPTRTSVQIGKERHIEDTIAGHINHSCTPNATVDQVSQCFIALRDIMEGEEITFDYNANEDALSSPFACECCGKFILGKNGHAVELTNNN